MSYSVLNDLQQQYLKAPPHDCPDIENKLRELFPHHAFLYRLDGHTTSNINNFFTSLPLISGWEIQNHCTDNTLLPAFKITWFALEANFHFAYNKYIAYRNKVYTTNVSPDDEILQYFTIPSACILHVK